MAVGIRTLREVKNAERDVVRVRCWSIVPRRKKRGRFEEDDVAAGIRNLREVKNAERDVVRVRRWSIVPRRKKRGRFVKGEMEPPAG